MPRRHSGKLAGSAITALVVVMASVAAGSMIPTSTHSPKTASLSLDALDLHPEMTGYEGNQSIYMANISYLPYNGYVIPDAAGSAYDVINGPDMNCLTCPSVNNSMNLTLDNSSHAPLGQFLVYFEDGHLDVEIPVVATGSDAGWTLATTFFSTIGTSITATIPGLPSWSGASLTVEYGNNFGLNATGVEEPGNVSKSGDFGQLALGVTFAALSAVFPEFGIPISAAQLGYAAYEDWSSDSGVQTGAHFTPATGSDYVNETFGTKGGLLGGKLVNQSLSFVNSYSGDTEIQLQLQPSDFQQAHYILITGQNMIGGFSIAQDNETVIPPAPAAHVTLNLSIVPAVQVHGYVYLHGGSTPTWDGGTVYVIENGQEYPTSTNSNGYYNFFAAPGAAIEVCGTYDVPLGNYEDCGNISGGSPVRDGATNWLNLTLVDPTGTLSGYVTSSSDGDAIDGADVSISASSGAYENVVTNSGGYYDASQIPNGTFTVTASANHYDASTKQFAISQWRQSATLDFSLSPTSGEGCVLTGTPILLETRQLVPVQDIVAGDHLVSVDLASTPSLIGDLVDNTVVQITVSDVNQVVDINQGLIFVSGWTDQPLLARSQNGSVGPIFLGQLNTTMSLYDALTGTWIPISSLQVLQGTFTVYDVVTSASFAASNSKLNNYVSGSGVPLVTKY